MGKEIYIDGTDVSGCEFYSYIESDKYPHRCTCYKDMYGANVVCDLADCCKNCYYKQLKRKEQKLDKIKTICEKETTKSTFCNGIENKDSQKLAIKILKIIIGGKNNG